MRLAGLLPIVLAGCLAAGPDLPAPEAPAVPPAADFAMDGVNCRELLVQAAVPLAAARAFVPERYEPLAAGDRALAFAALKVCDDLVLDGVSVGAASTSDVGVFVESPDGTDAFHYYQTWWLTDSPDLAARLEAQGWPGGLAETALEGSGLGPAAARVGWSEGAYRLEAAGAAGALAPRNLAVGWHDAPNGTVRVVKELASTAFGSGAGAVAAEGGPMADLLGASSSRGPALWNVYAMAGRVERAEVS